MPSYLPNLISIFRGTLSVFFLQHKTWLRVFAILVAMFTDVLDGFIARRFSKVSFMGAVIDPIMDRVFVFIAALIFYSEGKMELSMIFLMLGRDVAVFSFACFLFFTGKWRYYTPSSLLVGKVTTALQFAVLLLITLGYNVPLNFFFVFILLGIGAFLELFFRAEVKTL